MNKVYKENETIRIDFEHYCFISSPFIYVSRVIDDCVCLEIGIIYSIEMEGIPLIAKFKLRESSLYLHGMNNVVKYPLECIELTDANIYYKVFDSIQILDGTSCKNIISEIQ